MILEDLHVHSVYCDGKNTPEELVESAISKGVKKLGILCHSYIDFEPTGSLNSEKYPDFIKEISVLKDKYKGKIELLCGIEQDFFSKEPIVSFDYVIGSVHFFSDGKGFYPIDWSEELFINGVKSCFNGDYYLASEWYFNAVSKMAEKIKPNIIAHFDLITKFNEGDKLFDTRYDRYVNAYKSAIDRIVKLNIPFEINTGVISRGHRSEPYPSKPIIDYIKSKGGKFLLSSDAHSKENISFGFDKWDNLL